MPPADHCSEAALEPLLFGKCTIGCSRGRQGRLLGPDDHASWLNQIEPYLSILQPKALAPSDLGTTEVNGERIVGFERRRSRTAKPLQRKFIRAGFGECAKRLKAA